MEVNGSNGIHTSAVTAPPLPPKQANTLSTDVAALRQLVVNPIMIDQPTRTESAIDDVLSVIRHVLEDKLKTVDRHLNSRTEWHITFNKTKMDRIYTILSALARIISQVDLTPRREGDTSAFSESASVREAAIESINATCILLQQLNDDMRAQTRSSDTELRQLFSVRELVYHPAPTDEQLRALTVHRMKVGRNHNQFTSDQQYRLQAASPESIVRPTAQKRRTGIVDAEQRFIPNLYLSNEQRESAMNDARAGVPAETIAAKYSIRLRTAKLWVDSHGPRKPKKRKPRKTHG